MIFSEPNFFIKKSKIVRIPESSARLEGTAAEQTTNLGGWAPLPISLSCISLLLEALRDPYQQSLVYNLSGSDAQLMADYLDVVCVYIWYGCQIEIFIRSLAKAVRFGTISGGVLCIYLASLRHHPKSFRNVMNSRLAVIRTRNLWAEGGFPMSTG